MMNNQKVVLMNEMDLEIREERWHKEFDALEDDYVKLVKWWEKNRLCSWNSEEKGIHCKHWDKLVRKTLGKRIDDTWNLKMSMFPYYLEKITKTTNEINGET